jgi:PAS domain S-box-containing protein
VKGKRVTTFEGNNKMGEVYLLNQAFDSFKIATSKFERYYQHLMEKLQELDLELRKKNEELEINLKEKEEVKNHLNNILESLSTGVVVIDLRGKITTFNRAAENITGFTSKEVKGRDFDEILAPNFFHNNHLNFGSLKNMQENTEVETKIRRKGKDILHVRVSLSPVKTPQEETIGLVLTLQDITQMKRLEEQARRTNRLAAMGEMAVNIAHEIRNPLGSMELFATILRKELEGCGELKELAEHISSGVKSINNIISNLLLFIKPQQKPNFQIVDIHSPLNDSLLFSGHLVKPNSNIQIITSYDSEPLMVYGDLELLKQVSLNLILNAIQAMPRGGKLTISTRKVKDQQKNSNFVEIRFIDTGIGISREDMPRIFDPFFTKKERGTGLGLTIVHNIIKIHGGTIDIESSEGKGTICIVTLPLWEGKVKEKE